VGKRTLTREQKVWVKERDSYQCVLCGSKKDLHIHHVVGHRVLNLAVEHVENPCLLVTVCKRDHVGPNQSGKDENCIHPDMAWALRRYHKDNGAIARVFAWRNDKIAGKVTSPSGITVTTSNSCNMRFTRRLGIYGSNLGPKTSNK